MQDLRQALKPHLLKLVAEGLENAAAPFKPEALRTTVLKMAKSGFAEFRIRPDVPLDVRRTNAVRDGLAFLAREGIASEWSAVTLLPGASDNLGLMSGEYFELMVQLKA